MSICFLSSAFFKKTKFIGFLAMMVLAYLAGYANPMTTTDYQVYLTHYNSLGWEVSPFEKGYTELTRIFANIGLNYAQFRICFAFASFLILFVGVYLFTNKIALFAGLYGSTVFLNDATQIRNLMMISLVILGSGLLAKNNYVWKLFGIAILLISTQFHDLGFAFALIIIPLSFFKLKSLTSAYKYTIIGSYVLGIILLTSSHISIVQLMATFLTKFSSRSNSADNVLANFGRGNSLGTIIVIWISLLLVAVLIVVLIRACAKTGVSESKLKILFICSAMSVIVNVLIVLAPDYSRISRNSFLFLLILICVTLEQQTVIYFNKSNFLKLFLTICVLMCTTYVNTEIWGSTYYNSLPYLTQIKK